MENHRYLMLDLKDQHWKHAGAGNDHITVIFSF